MPADNIKRAIMRGTGELEGGQIDEFTYEGYGPAGVAVIVNALTDNRNRTAADVRHAFQAPVLASDTDCAGPPLTERSSFLVRFGAGCGPLA